MPNRFRIRIGDSPGISPFRESVHEVSVVVAYLLA
jgi:hypothetical protein